MTVAWLDALISILRLAMMFGIVVISILLFWHLRRINKPILSLIFWWVMFLTATTPLMQIFQSGLPLSEFSTWYLGLACAVPMTIIGCYFINPLRPVAYDYDEDHEDDEPFDIPDEV